ncbi:tRNA modification GTPase MnmE [Clostridia bacterium]|nr:tRNA modification GTPase MnmE [Clostridia bacterium]
MITTDTTIAAIATPQTDKPGGISVIRISGTDAVSIAGKVFRIFAEKGKRRKSVSGMKSHTVAYGKIFDGKEHVDNGMVTVFLAPKSYTGEDVVEISCHGGVYVTKRVLSACFTAGATPAGAGEFTKRALLNGKLSLTEAESVIDIINAENKQYLSFALQQKEGALQQKIDEIAQTILGISAQLTAWIDYPEEVVAEGLDDFEISSDLGQLSEAHLKLKLLLESYQIGKVLRDGIVTAIVGKPNVGKSTIMNLLSGKKRSIVTPKAGTTRDIIEENVNIGGAVLVLSDCAGMRETDDEAEGIGVEIMLRRMKEAMLVLAVFDNSRELAKEDYVLLELLHGKNAICVINKSDLETKLDLSFLCTQFNTVTEISAKQPESLGKLTAVIEKYMQLKRLDMSSGFLANERQRKCAVKAERALQRAIKEIEAKKKAYDILSIELESALSALYELSGKRVSDEILETVFARFCVGK